MRDVHHLSVAVARPWAAVYEAIWRPERFPAWASGLSRGALRREGDVWVATGPGGPVRIAFTDHNSFGVMDHTVHLVPGQQVDMPMRVVANGEGAEIMVTLFRQPGMSDADFARDIAWVERDLAALKRLLEGETGAPGDKPQEEAHTGSGTR